MPRALLLLLVALPLQAQDRPFRIRVVDEATRRGVPMVELETVHGVLWVTDSAGQAAIDGPGLLGRKVWFYVKSHGYEYPADGFGYRGFATVVEPGGSVEIAVTRVNVAERLYRVTGEGIYRDSVLLGDRPPIAEPLLAGGVLGQDSVQNLVYRGRLWWFWGDTCRAAYPLGNFAMSAAVSDLPGLDPAVGVDLTYYVGEDGFSRKMCPIEGPGPVWLDAFMVVRRGEADRMVAHYARIESLEKRHEHGFAAWNDATETFEPVARWPLDRRTEPMGHPFLVETEGETWYYLTNPYPALRVRATWEDVVDPERYEAFTCLAPGTPWDAKDPAIDRGPDGEPRWGWKRGVPTVAPAVEAKAMQRTEGWQHLTDVETGKPVLGHSGSVSWNEHRGRWVMIANEAWGRSMVGEVWYAEGDTPLGPWVWARRIVTHDDYSFYNVRHHPYFDRDGGRTVLFEGTYTATFSGAKRRTPRYDYNQVMYRLDLDDPRVLLPAPVYEVGDRLGTLEAFAERAALAGATVPFYALPPGRTLPGSIEVRRTADGRLAAEGEGEPVFRAMPATADACGALAPLFEYRDPDSGRRLYRPETWAPGDGWDRASEPICMVWPSPRLDPPRDTTARHR